MTLNQTVYIFPHIPKTGGTTLRIHFQTYLKDQEEFIHLANRGDKRAKEKDLLPFSERSLQSRDVAKVIFGHKVNYNTKRLIPNKIAEEVVFFRDPYQWEISRFNQYVNRRKNTGLELITFEQWIQSVNKTHSQFDWFLSNYLMLGPLVKKLPIIYKERLLFYVLDNIKHVCFLHELNEKSNYFFEKLNIPSNPVRKNVVGKQKTQFYINNDSNNALLEKTCKNDAILFERIKSKYCDN